MGIRLNLKPRSPLHDVDSTEIYTWIASHLDDVFDFDVFAPASQSGGYYRRDGLDFVIPLQRLPGRQLAFGQTFQ